MATRSLNAPSVTGSGARGFGLPYLPGLDGLRALAVVAVLIYHADWRWMPGGFLGVEVFFVISGYLITSLLLVEWEQHGRIDLKRFWLRRARRLLPALYGLLLAVLLVAVLHLTDEVARLRGDVAAALGYATNWYLILSEESYFETVWRPSLLRHLWSLAIEEQFYLVWPLLFAVVRRWSRRWMALILLLGAAASSMLMVSLYRPNIDPSRVYYGTDTRAAGLLIGAALAAAWPPGAFGHGRLARWSLDVLGLGAFVALFGCHLMITEFQPFLYRGGFLVTSLTTAVLIAVVVHPRARLVPALLGWRPLRWVGLRSYGIYLWHWPIFSVTRPQVDVPIDGWLLLVFRLAVTLVCAELSYRCIERPIRAGVLSQAWRGLRDAQGSRRRWLRLGWSGVALLFVAVSALLGGQVVRAQPPTPPPYLAVRAIDSFASYSVPPVQQGHVAEPTSWPVDVTAPVGTATIAAPTASAPLTATQRATTGALPLAPARATGTPQPAGVPSVTPVQPTPTPVPDIIAIGDSVMIGAAEELLGLLPTIRIDAASGRQAAEVIQVLQGRQEAGQLGPMIILHVGNNGTFTAEQLDEMMDLLSEAQRVVFVNAKVPRKWEETNNEVIVEGVKRHAKAVLVDWRGTSIDQPELFWGDDIHLRPEGAQVYAALIAQALADLVPIQTEEGIGTPTAIPTPFFLTTDSVR